MPPPISPIFHTTPLTSTLLTDPSYKSLPQSSASRFVDPFFRITARTSSAVLATHFLYRTAPSPEGHLLIHCGRGVTGQNGIAHGGFLATVMDEVTGNLISATGLDDGLGMFTVKLETGYKRPVFVGGTTTSSLGGSGSGSSTIGGGGGGDTGETDAEKELGTGASVIVATAKLEKVEGRKVFVEAVIRDQQGEVCTTAEVIFVKKRPATGVL